MTQVEMQNRMTSLLADFKQTVRKLSLEQARKKFREDHKLIYVKTYTVQAHFRKMTPRRKKTLKVVH